MATAITQRFARFSFERTVGQIRILWKNAKMSSPEEFQHSVLLECSDFLASLISASPHVALTDLRNRIFVIAEITLDFPKNTDQTADQFIESFRTRLIQLGLL